MPPVVLAILKYMFLFLIFMFLLRAVRAMVYEISGPKKKGSAPKAAAPAPRTKAKPPEKITVTPAEGRSQNYDITDELILGRGEKCHVTLTDTYASQIHSRIFRRGETVFLEDMGSTNGTYLNRRKVTAPVEVNRGDKARIGKTEIDFKR